MSQVQEFYTKQNVFITGGTGFLGRILCEKLLRSCPDIGTIYLLVRAKKGKSPQERIEELVNDPVFDVLRDYYPDFSKKIVGVAGDTGAKGLGLSTIDRARIVGEVSVIFHLAATIRFNDKFERAVAENVNSVKDIVDIGRECKNLKVGVHVSTAYSFCVRKIINEEIYPPPLSYVEANKLVEDAKKKNLSEDEMADFVKTAIGVWPNTYTFTKAIGEGVVAEYAKTMPFAVFRPAIVMSSYKEPVPGWLSGILGVQGLICAAGLGILRVNLVDGERIKDFVPVDYVCNALITSAWKTAITKRRIDENIPVYNYVSSGENPITWNQFDEKMHRIGRIFPSMSAIYYPAYFSTKSTMIYRILQFFLHYIPAIIIDGIAKLAGKQPGMYKVACRIRDGIYALQYFGARQWEFGNQEVQNLWKTIDPKDKQVFPFNIRDLDWDEYTLKMWRGFRKYIMGDRDGNENEARRRHDILYIVHVIVRLLFWSPILWIIWKVFF